MIPFFHSLPGRSTKGSIPRDTACRIRRYRDTGELGWNACRSWIDPDSICPDYSWSFAEEL